MNKKNWTLTPIFLIFAVLMYAMSFISVRYNPYLSIAEFCVSTLALILVIVMNIRFSNYVKRIVKSSVKKTENIDHTYLENFSFPVVVVGTHDDIVWCNSSFVTNLTKGREPYGNKVGHFIGNRRLSDFIDSKPVKIKIDDKFYRIYGNVAKEATILYYIDDTYYKNIETEFNNRKGSVAIVVFDNAEDFDTDSDGEAQSEFIVAFEKVIQKWASDFGAMCCKLSPTRYILVFEESAVRKITEGKFSILEEIRSIRFEDKYATASIGVGRGKDSLRESELSARKALDMALGRGGDQVAIAVKDDYEFYGGVSGGVEKRSKVRTRTFANNIKTEIKLADNVILMGHNFSDFDCVGAAIGLYSTISKSLSKEVYIACNEQTSNAKILIDKAKKSGFENVIISPEDAIKKIKSNTLLIIVDTHISTFIENKEIYEKCKKVIIIDHHRKMVNFIKDALIFFHEPTASSTCEMVSELISYMGDDYLSSFEAGALLSGIMLDTKNFVMKTGSRTFEAAAYLKRKGADTIKVKRMFAGDVEDYRNKSSIITGARIIDNIAVATEDKIISNNRVVSSQAADELLGIEGVKASFVVFKISDDLTGITARSYGKTNVQIIMEEMGGGGHLTMAASQIKNISVEDAEQLLLSTIKKLRQDGKIQ